MMPYSPGNLAALDSNGYAGDAPSEAAAPMAPPASNVLSPNGQTLSASFSPLSSAFPPAAVSISHPTPAVPPPLPTFAPDAQLQMSTSCNLNPPVNASSSAGFFPPAHPHPLHVAECNHSTFGLQTLSTPRLPAPAPYNLMMSSQLLLPPLPPLPLPPPPPPVVAPLPVLSTRPATIIRPMGTLQVSIGGQAKSLQVLRLETTTISSLGNDSLKLSTAGTRCASALSFFQPHCLLDFISFVSDR